MDLHRPTILMTGATGLVGSFLLARLLQLGFQVAVLVRGSPNATVAQRIETALAPHETVTLLPRPRMIQAELTSPGLGLHPQDIDWLSARELIVVHSAASIRFVLDSQSGEPYKTNVEGTRNLLDVCSQLNVRAFHYVSTAYVGPRQLAVLNESLPKSDQKGGNDYETSKIQSELLVAAANSIGTKFIHRPSIVVGDSQTGLTTTFHGFYAPLKIGWQYAQAYGFSEEATARFRQHLGMSSQDKKNLVPVDWLANVISFVIETTQSQARQNDAEPRILHWTNPQPVACSTMERAISESIAERIARSPAAMRETLVPSGEQFRSQMQVYESYFECDPQFENCHAKQDAPHLACPTVDLPMLNRLATFAIDANFGWPKPQPPSLPLQPLAEALRALPTQSTFASLPTSPRIDLELLGTSSPERLSFGKISDHWFLLSQPSLVGGTVLKVVLAFAVFADCMDGKTSLIDAVDTGRCLITGNSSDGCLVIVNHWAEDIKIRLPK